jgi:hypothetical protein
VGEVQMKIISIFIAISDVADDLVPVESKRVFVACKF